MDSRVFVICLKLWEELDFLAASSFCVELYLSHTALDVARVRAVFIELT